jgi:hypothetical protein
MPPHLRNKQWLKTRNGLGPFSFWEVGMSFWSSLFGGSNPTLSKDIGQFGQIGGFATGLGEKNLSQSSNFMSSILSGDQSKIGGVLGPEISNIKGQGQSAKMGASQFNNRGGGTNATMQSADDTSRASINKMISSLLGNSASGLASSGSSLLGQGMQAYGQQAQLSQEQMSNWSNSILGKGITSGISSAESFGLGAAGGSLSGTGAGKGAMSGLNSYWSNSQ